MTEINKRKIIQIEAFDEPEISKMKAAVTDDFYIKNIYGNTDKKTLKEELKDAEVVIGAPPLSLLLEPEVNCPKLKFVQMVWAGTDMYTAVEEKFPSEQIMLANGSGAYGLIMSQFVIGMTLSVMLNFNDYHRQQTAKIWERRGPVQSLDHARVLIFGAGDIGTAVAQRLQGFDAYCIGVCRNVDKKRPYFNELCTLENAEKYIPSADVIVCCIPNNAATVGYMDRTKIGLMKESAVIVNVGRGNFIDCMALNDALNNRKIWGAALDVTSPEPLPKDHPLWENPRCMITPHASGASFGHFKETEKILCDIVCENLKRYCDGEEIKNRIY
ncbi:MAG: D-2-hydroxyacid dehydrogenase [Lachnospiraceae bacterium]|nr:D-2-hydroxyacid dehydrogenase [Lachnospiraceae bacterium]